MDKIPLESTDQNRNVAYLSIFIENIYSIYKNSHYFIQKSPTNPPLETTIRLNQADHQHCLAFPSTTS